MAFYLVTRPAAAMVVGNDLMTITSVGKSLNIWSLDLNGIGRSSLEGEMSLAYSTGGATPGTTLTPARLDDSNPTVAAFLARYGWTTQPSLVSNKTLWLFGVNNNGGKDRFPGYPQPIPVPVNGQVSLRSLIGTHNVNQTWLIEEFG